VITGLQTNLQQIYRRTNELTVYESCSKVSELSVQPQVNKKLLPQKTLVKSFASLMEIQMGTILDAQDSYGKWYAGIVVDRNFNYTSSQYSIKVHFFEFPERWDEWYRDDTDGTQKIAPFGTHAEEPKDKVLTMPMMHRKRVLDTAAAKVTETHQIFGTPFYLSIGNWYTWEEFHLEVVAQTQRYIRQSKNSNNHHGPKLMSHHTGGGADSSNIDSSQICENINNNDKEMMVVAAGVSSPVSQKKIKYLSRLGSGEEQGMSPALDSS
jgi:hypothetical protein